MKAYHFNNGHNLRDGRPLPELGEWLEHTGSLEPCESGLHASEHPLDALNYASGAQPGTQPGPQHLPNIVNGSKRWWKRR